MDQAAKDRIRHEIEDEVRTLFPGAVRRVDWHSHSDDPHFEPGELLPSLILTEPNGRRIGRPEPGAAVRKFNRAHGPAVKQFRRDLAQRWPEIQHLGFGIEDASGHSRGGIVMALDDPGEEVESDITHVMVRLKAPELEIVDTLITAGIANSRAEAIGGRWPASASGPPTHNCASTHATSNDSRRNSDGPTRQRSSGRNRGFPR